MEIRYYCGTKNGKISVLVTWNTVGDAPMYSVQGLFQSP